MRSSFHCYLLASDFCCKYIPGNDWEIDWTSRSTDTAKARLLGVKEMGRSQKFVAPVPAALGYPPSRSIELAPEDWLWATWRSRTPLPRPEPRSFDRKEALSRLDEVTAGRPTYRHQWADAKISISLSPEEALFWFLAITSVVPQLEDYEQVKQKLATASLADSLSVDQVLAVLNTAQIYSAAPELIVPVVNLFPLPELIDLLSDDRLFQPQPIASPAWTSLLQSLPMPNLPTYPTHRSFDWRILSQLVNGFRQYILPYLSQAEIAALHSRLQSKLDPSQWSLRPVVSERIGLFLLAAVLGMHNALLNLVETWTEESCKQDCYHFSQEIVFGLGDRNLVEYHMRRLKLPLSARHAEAWLAHTEHTALDYIQEQLAPHLAQRVIVPEAAPQMLGLTLSHRPAKSARQWLQDHPVQAIAGLIPVAAGRDQIAEGAIDFLRLMKRKGYVAYIRQCLSGQPPEIASKVQTLVFDFQDVPPLDQQSTPSWWQQAFEQHPLPKKTKASTWLDPLALPPVLIGQHCLSSPQIAALLTALQQSTLTTAHPAIAALKTHANPASLNDFAWKLFELWLSEGAPAKESWAMVAIGLLSNDTSVLKLASLIREMPGAGHHKRAAIGLECLRSIGTDLALMQINSIAQKVKYKGLKKKAEECIAAIAHSRQLTREQLEDRIVPDCGLDERGSRQFDYGSRQFRLVLGSEMQPLVRDSDGKLKTNLPRPKAGDALALAEQAMIEWKLLKQQIQAVTKTQVDRLQQAMITQRCWQLEAFEAFLVRHPLMTNLAQRLIWAHSSSNEISFRITEDLTYADVHDQTLKLDNAAEINLVHPAQLSVALRNRWGELLSDYELIQPFRQLNRTVFNLEPEEVDRQTLIRFQAVDVEQMTLTAILSKTGWKPVNHSLKPSHHHCKSFPFANITAVIEHPPNFFSGLGTRATWFQSCFFMPGLALSLDSLQEENALRLGDVDPIVVSEVLRNLGAIAAKGE